MELGCGFSMCVCLSSDCGGLGIRDSSLVGKALCQIAVNAKCFRVGRALNSHAVHSGLDINLC